VRILAHPLQWISLKRLQWVFDLAGECIRRGEGGGVGKGKKDTGYLYKAFMVARVAIDGS
jgi:hypothetical protein